MEQENNNLRCRGRPPNYGICHRGPPGSPAQIRLPEKYALYWENPGNPGNGRGMPMKEVISKTINLNT